MFFIFGKSLFYCACNGPGLSFFNRPYATYRKVEKGVFANIRSDIIIVCRRCGFFAGDILEYFSKLKNKGSPVNFRHPSLSSDNLL